MKNIPALLSFLFLTLLIVSCDNPAQLLQAKTWIMYERIQTETETGEEAKSKFEKADRALVLNFAHEQVDWSENGVSKTLNWELIENNQLKVNGKNYNIVRVGERGLILSAESNGYEHQLLFAPEDCPCWDKK